MLEDTFVNVLKEIFGTNTAVTNSHKIPFTSADGTPAGLASISDLASVLGVQSVNVGCYNRETPLNTGLKLKPASSYLLLASASYDNGQTKYNSFYAYFCTSNRTITITSDVTWLHNGNMPNGVLFSVSENETLVLTGLYGNFYIKLISTK